MWYLVILEFWPKALPPSPELLLGAGGRASSSCNEAGEVWNLPLRELRPKVGSPSPELLLGAGGRVGSPLPAPALLLGVGGRMVSSSCGSRPPSRQLGARAPKVGSPSP